MRLFVPLSLITLATLFAAPPSHAISPRRASPALSLAHSGDIVTATLNGKPLGTQRGVGNEVKFDTAGALQDGQNTLQVRVEVWGHANFDDGRNPALYLNGPRGVWGPVRLGDTPLKPAAGWQVSGELSQPPALVAGPAGPLALGTDGSQSFYARLLPLTGPIAPTGYVLSLGGKNLLGHLFVNGHPLGRCLLGPALDPHLNGGPSDQFYVPAAWLSPGPRPNRLILWTMATGPDAAFTKMDWAPVPATPIAEEIL